jgi:hypothetical protein
MSDIYRRGAFVSIPAGKKEFIMPASIYNRAKQGQIRSAKIRRPIEKTINGMLFVFTKKELEKVWEETSGRNIGCFLREEINEKAMMSKKLSKMRSTRLKMEADAAAEQMRM